MKIAKTRLYLITLLSLLAISLIPQTVKAAQTATVENGSAIEGKVQEKDTGNGVKDVLVKLLNEDGSFSGYSTRTDENGDYQMSPPDGKYKIQFSVGDIGNDVDGTKIPEDEVSRIRNVLKYNGQDYYSADIDTKDRIGSDDIQVIFYLDVSGTTGWQITTQDGQTKTVLQAECESLKTLINNLLNSDQPIWVALYLNREDIPNVPVTRNEELLDQTLDKLLENGPVAGKNIEDYGFDYITNNLVSNNSGNRVISVISDGIPSGGHTIVGASTEFPIPETENNDAGVRSYNKMVELRNQGYKIMSVLFGGKYFKAVYNDRSCDLVAEGNNGVQLVKAIENDLNDQIENSFDTTKIENINTYNINYKTEEDRARGIEISDQFRGGFYWENVSMFLPIDNYNNSPTNEGRGTSYEEAQYMSEKTYFTDTSDRIYNISSGGGDKARFNLEIIEKMPAELSITAYTSALRVTLANGETVYFNKSEYNRKKENILPLMCFIDSEIAQGANVEVEYTIHIARRSSNVIFDDLQIVDHLPQNLVYNAGTPLLTETGKKNGDYWQDTEIDKETLKDGEYFNPNYSGMKDELNQQHIISKGISIGNIGDTNTKDLKVVVTLLASGQSDMEYIQNPDRAEVFSYKTTYTLAAIENSAYSRGTPRRMKAVTGKNVITKDLNSEYLYAASFEGTDFTSTADANVVTILPPTGDETPKANLGTIIALIVIEIILINYYVRLHIITKLKKLGL